MRQVLLTSTLFLFTILSATAGVPTFQTISLPTGGSPSHDTRTIAIGDYDGDGRMDLFIAAATGSNSEVTNQYLFRNTVDVNGDLIFTSEPSPSGDSSFNTARWVDLNQDGVLDLYLGGDSYKNSALLKGLGGGVFQAWGTSGLNMTVNNQASTFVDYDGDGDLDAFFCSGNGNTRFYTNNTAAGSQTLSFTAVDTTRSTHNIAWIDYDNDGDLDAFLLDGSTTGNPMMINDGAGGFTYQTFTPIAYPNQDDINFNPTTKGVAWGDHDGDGDFDLIVGGEQGQHTTHLGDFDVDDNKHFRNDGNGVLTPLTWGPQVLESGFLDAAWADIDNDGDLDLLAVQEWADNDHYFHIFENDGTGSFTKAHTAGGRYEAISIEDFDGDGALDVALAANAPKTNRVLVSQLANGNHYLRLQLTDKNGGVTPIGARLKSHGDDRRRTERADPRIGRRRPRAVRKATSRTLVWATQPSPISLKSAGPTAKPPH